MDTYIKQPARKKYKKAYKSKSLPVYPIFQSQEVEIRGQRFVMVGQYLLPHSPFFSRFDLLDQQLTSINHEAGKEVYEILARLQVMPLMQKLKAPLEAQKGMEIENIQNEIDEVLVGHSNITRMVLALEQLSDYAVSLRGKPILEECDHEPFQEKWQAFWTLYEERSSYLRRMSPQFVEKKSLFQEATQAEQKLFSALLEEAWVLNQLFTCLAPSEEAQFNTIDELIEWSYKLGRINPGDELDVALTKFEWISYKPLKLLLLFFYWIVMPLILIIFVIEFTFEVLLFPAIVLFLYRPMYNQFVKRLQLQKSAKVERINQERLKEIEFDQPNLSEQMPSPDTKSSKKQASQQESKELFSVNGTVLNYALMAFYFTFASLILTLFFGFTNGWGNTETKVTLIVTIILGVFSICLPYLRLSVRKITLQDDGLLLGKFKVYAKLINEVIWDKESGQITIKHADHDVDTSLIINKAMRKQTEEELRNWIDVVDVPYREGKKK
ncbi:hypothetical protein [Bacillus sp. JCM 19034]|uniref:hypothetical protein n=1 Tax=Bacillus sp. JCM 19034 TaxID=1481928 RepID=UPI00078211A6|nr:hypothetical protein [Bacillus sp. JCM 19034]